MEILSYANNIWIHVTNVRGLPFLMVNEKTFIEAKSYFKEWFNIEICNVNLESTDDTGVVMAVVIDDIVEFSSLKKIPDVFRVGVEELYYDECGHTNAYLKLYISINQQMENV